MFLILETEQDARDRSREAWEQRLGRKKNPEDVTEFLWTWDVGKDGRAALVISEDEHRLKAEELAVAVEELPNGKGENWEKPEMATDETDQLKADG